MLCVAILVLIVISRLGFPKSASIVTIIIITFWSLTTPCHLGHNLMKLQSSTTKLLAASKKNCYSEMCIFCRFSLYTLKKFLFRYLGLGLSQSFKTVLLFGFGFRFCVFLNCNTRHVYFILLVKVLKYFNLFCSN